MPLRDLIATAVTALKVNLTRSRLTVLGVVIGVAAIMMVASIGESAQSLIISQIQSFGTRVISIAPGREPSGPSDFASIFSESLKTGDLEALRRPGAVPGITNITPIVAGSYVMEAGNESTSATTAGSAPFIQTMMNLELHDGQFFTDDDVAALSRVVVLGQDVAKDLFGEASQATGQTIRVKDQSFRVIGVLEGGGAGFANFDSYALLPWTTAHAYLSGTSHFTEIDIEVESEEIIPRVVADVEILLRQRHGITDPEKDDFYVNTIAEATEIVSQVTGIVTALISAVAAISLVVGGIGIMNIMLASVAERTREIGLRKAIGATNRDIRNQFLIEAIILTVLGGIIGIIVAIIFGIIAAIVLTNYVGLAWDYIFPIVPTIIGVTVSIATGLIFGLLPARKASHMDPVEALRYE